MYAHNLNCKGNIIVINLLHLELHESSTTTEQRTGYLIGLANFVIVYSTTVSRWSLEKVEDP